MATRAAPAKDAPGIEYSDMRFGQCKALLDVLGKDGMPRCCGKPQQKGKVYCAEHYSRYYITPKQRT
jgi:hypothetical protein